MPRRKRGAGLGAARDTVKVDGRKGIEVGEETKPYTRELPPAEEQDVAQARPLGDQSGAAN